MAEVGWAKRLVVGGWGLVALSVLGYAASALGPRGAGRHDLAVGAAVVLALAAYWRLVVRPRLTRRNEDLLLGPFLLVQVASLAVYFAFSSPVALSVANLSLGLAGVSLGSLRRRGRRPGRP